MARLHGASRIAERTYDSYAACLLCSRDELRCGFMERQGYPKESAMELHGEGEVRRGSAERHASASDDSEPKGGDGYGRSWRQGDTLYIGVRAHTIISHRMEYELSKSAVYLPRKYRTGITFVRR